MVVSEAILHLTDALSATLLPLSPAQQRLVEILREMPLYLERDALVDWERDVRVELDARGENADATRILELVSELANVYAFDETRATKIYVAAADLLAEQGMSAPPAGVIDGLY
jgi:hypothetical protein